jgi:hypothetical protein
LGEIADVAGVEDVEAAAGEDETFAGGVELVAPCGGGVEAEGLRRFRGEHGECGGIR